MTSGHDVSGYVGTLGLVKSFFSKFSFKKIKPDKVFSLISFGTITSTVTTVSNGLVVVLTTFRVPDKDIKGVWSLVCPYVFPVFFCPDYPSLREGFFENVFLKRIRDQYR